MNIRFGTVCSGVEAASLAWGPLGWQPEFFAEIDPFPCAVLAHRHGSNLPGEPHAVNGVPNYGDMTKYEDWPDHGQQSTRPIDLLAGGTPCQAFSVAGLGKGLDDPRGNLSLTFGAIARRFRPPWLVWENVTGVLSSNGGRDFASILGLLSGRTIEPHRTDENGQPVYNWKNAGIVEGITKAYGLAWRVLDSQFVRVDGFSRAVPQRRRRVVLVGHLGNAGRAAAVLFERESLSRHIPPCIADRQRLSRRSDKRLVGGGVWSKIARHLRARPSHGAGLKGVAVVAGCLSGNGKTRPGDTLQCASLGHLIAFPTEMSGTQVAAMPGVSPSLSVKHSMAVAFDWTVRRLTPRECERLQGMPDDHTRVPGWNGWRDVGEDESLLDLQAEGMRIKQSASGRWRVNDPDGPRYKAIGNSWAVNVFRWVGMRIEAVQALIDEGAL